MLYYLDTMVVIYAVEGNPADQQRALTHLAALERAGHRFAISDLTRTECLAARASWRGLVEQGIQVLGSFKYLPYN